MTLSLISHSLTYHITVTDFVFINALLLISIDNGSCSYFCATFAVKMCLLSAPSTVNAFCNLCGLEFGSTIVKIHI